MLKPEKNRYLELNGDNVEHGKYRRHFSSVAFSTMLITQGLNLAISDDPAKGILILPAQALSSVLSRYHQKRALKDFFKDSESKVIDTKPTKPNPTNPNDLKSAYHTKLIESLCFATVIPFYYVIKSGEQNIFSTALLLAPIMSESLATVYRMHKVTRGDWAIIDRDQMKKIEDKVPEKNGLKLASTLSPVQY